MRNLMSEVQPYSQGKSVLRLAVSFLVAAATNLSVPTEARSQVSTASEGKTAFVIVTDVDDTIKVSHILDPIGKVIRFFQDPIAFAGMSTLYHALLNEANESGRDHGFAVVSGTPFILELAIWNFLSEFRFPEPSFLITRPIDKQTFDFKSNEIAKLLDQRTLDRADVLLIGDDTEYDYSAYAFAKKNVADLRSMNTQIFIRRVSGEAPNVGETFAFDSAADIAVIQYAYGRLSEKRLADVFAEVETEQRLQRLFVPGEYCPDESSPRLSEDPRVAHVNTAIISRLKKVENHLRRVCRGLSVWFLNN